VSAPHVVFRVAYARYGELRDDVAQQMVRGGLLVKVRNAPGLTLDSLVDLELVLPDGTKLQGSGRVLQVFAGFGVLRQLAKGGVLPHVMQAARKKLLG
jgi:hypothetical protein